MSRSYDKRAEVIVTFNLSFRYLDNVLSIDDRVFEGKHNHI